MKAEDLPEAWSTARLLDLVGSDGLMSDGDWIESKDQDPLGDVRLIQLADIGDGVYLDRSNRFLTNAKAQELQCTFLEPSDVLIARMPDPLGRACMFPGDTKRSVTAVDVCIFRSGSLGVDQGWLMHMVNSPAVRSEIVSFATGTTRRRISGKNLKSIRVPVAPLNEQRRIADKIDELFSDIEQGEEALRRAKTLLQRYRQAVLKAAVTGELTRDWRAQHEGEVESGEQLLARIFETRRAAWEKAVLAKMAAKGQRAKDDSWKRRYKEPIPPDTSDLTELPHGWVWTSIDQLVSGRPRSLQSGPFGSNLKHEEFQSEGVLVLGIDNVGDGQFSMGSEHRIREEKFSTLEKYQARPGDVLVTVMASLGRSCVVPRDLETAIVTKHVYRISMEEDMVLPEHVNLVLQAPGITRARMFKDAQGQTRPGLNSDILRRLPVPLPPREEQGEILAHIAELMSNLDPVAGAIDGETARVKPLRQAILRAAFAGDLVTQDPNDEPASVLLERIAAERAAMKTAGRPRRGPKRKREGPEKVAERPAVREPVLG